MSIERRGFFGKALVAGAGLAVLARGVIARAKGLPSDPGPMADGAGKEGVIVLPPFEKDLPITLEHALRERKSERSYDPDKPLSHEQISRLLWAANGVNRSDGHLTTPSAVARYPVDVYAALPEGVYLFNSRRHQLELVKALDIRKDIPLQPGFKKAGMIMLYVINQSRFQGDENPWADLEIGCMVQDLYLEAAGLGLATCVFALVRMDKVPGILGLKKNQVLRIAQAAGVRG